MFQSQLKKQSAKAHAFYMDQVVHCKTMLSTETIAYGDICGARKLYEVCYIYSLLNESTTVPMARVKWCVIAGPSNYHITFNKKNRSLE